MNKHALPCKLGKYRGKTYSRYTVTVKQSGLSRGLWERDTQVEVVAASPAEACWAIQREIAPHLEHPTEFLCAGPKGGITSRFIGWESLVGWQMLASRPDSRQLTFPVWAMKGGAR
jgi:hypothetical protein